VNPALLALLLAAAPAAPLADVPFDDAFGLVFFDASIGDSGPLSFMLDTGFDTSVLNADVAARLGMKLAEVKSEAAPGGAIDVGMLPPVTLGIGALRIEGVRLSTVPLTSLAGFVGRPLDGILGHDVLESRVVEIDYPARRLRFRAAEGYEHEGPGQVLPVTFRDSQTLVTAGVEMPGGRTVFGSFKVDTGSFVAGLNLNFVRDSRLIGPGIAELRVRGVAVGGDTESRLFRAAAFVLGTDRVERPLLGYTVDSAGFENRADAGTLGGALLSRHRLILDYPRRRIILERGDPAPTPRAREDLAGAILTSTGPGFVTIVVAQVIAGTPAAEAGLAAGDEIVTAAGRPVSLREARELLEQPGPLALVIRREGKQRTVPLDRRPVLP